MRLFHCGMVTEGREGAEASSSISLNENEVCLCKCRKIHEHPLVLMCLFSTNKMPVWKHIQTHRRVRRNDSSLQAAWQWGIPWLCCLSSIPHIPGGNERSRPEREEEDESERSSVSRRLPRQHWKITLPPTSADPVVLRSSLMFSLSLSFFF